MSDLDSMRALLKLESGINSQYVDVAISDSIRFVRSEPLWFNGARQKFTLEDSVYSYPLPVDFLGLRGHVYSYPEGSTTQRIKLCPSTPDEIEDFLFTGADYGSEVTSGRAAYFAVDLLDKKMIFAPMPSVGDVISYRYTRDLGTPDYSITTSSSAPPSVTTTVTLKAPGGGPLSSTFTNEWFGEGFKLVKERAAYELWSRFNTGTEEAQMRANGALTRFAMELNRIKGETAQISSVTNVRKHL